MWGGLAFFPQSALRAIVFFNCYDDQIHLLLGMEGGWKEHFWIWNCVIIIWATGFAQIWGIQRERECHVAKWEVSYTRLSSVQDGSKTKGSETQPWSLKSGLPSDSFMEKCGVWCTFIGWSTYAGHDVNVVEILMHKKTRKRKGHRWFHKRRERNCPQPQTDKISQRGEQPAQGHSPTVGKNQIHSPFTNAKSCLLSFQLSLLFP